MSIVTGVITTLFLGGATVVILASLLQNLMKQEPLLSFDSILILVGISAICCLLRDIIHKEDK